MGDKKNTGGRNYWDFRDTVPLEPSVGPLEHSSGKLRTGPPTPPRKAQPDFMREREAQLQEIITLAQYGAAYPGFRPQPIDVAALRRRMQMTRAQFARRFGFPVETVRHWERGDRKPRRAALVLLNLIARNSQVAPQLLRNRSC